MLVIEVVNIRFLSSISESTVSIPSSPPAVVDEDEEEEEEELVFVFVLEALSEEESGELNISDS